MSKWPSAIAVVAVLTLALLALYRLLLLQYDSGDAYPEYSSFRADPLGLLIFHEAMASTGASPQRNLAPLDRAAFAPDTTLLLAGAAISEDDVSTLARIEAYAQAGGRFVILFRPGQDFAVQLIAEEKEHEKEEKEKLEKKNKENDEEKKEDDRRARGDEMLDALMPRADISERWGFDYSVRGFDADAGKHPVVEVVRGQQAPEILSKTLEWHSSLVFTDIASDWTVIYERGVHPVVIERKWGDGSIVVATDNYLVSNEAMLADREPAFLAWLAGSERTVIFEETHLGVARSTGLMTLVHQYGLIPVLLAGILLTLMFIWKNAVPLVPKHPAASHEDDVVAAHSTVAGIASLVRRAIPQQEILDTSWRLFQAPAMRKAPIKKANRVAVEAALAADRDKPARRRDPVATYNQISTIINERKANP